MGWVRISDDFYDHPAHVDLDLAAWGLWVWSLAWANRNLTDGVLPRAAVKRMDPAGTAAGALMAAGRLRELDEGRLVIHDYLDFQPSAEEIRRKREKERERWQRRAVSTPDSAPTPRGVAPPSANTPRVSQPQPQPSDKSEGDAATPPPAPKQKRGTRIPTPFDVTDPMVDWVEKECAGVDWDRETKKFVAYWTSAPGQRGVKADWGATWKVWMMKAADFGGR